MSVKEVRNSIGGDILIAMAANEEFPISNVHRVAKTMQEYFVTEGFNDILVELGYTWRPVEDYWERHLADVRDYLRKEKRLFLEYRREKEDVGFKGAWEFVRKGDFNKVMDKERTGITTRVDTYNDRVDDSKDKWKALLMPHIRQTLVEASVETSNEGKASHHQGETQ